MGIFKRLYEEHLKYENWNATGTLDRESEADRNKMTKRSTECVVFVGRFQPFTSGHAEVVERMVKTKKVPVICLVKGRKSSLDKVKNPFTADVQVKIIDDALKARGISAQIVEINTGFVTNIIEACRLELDLEPVEIYAGGEGDVDNRLAAYQNSYDTGKVTVDGETVPIPEAYNVEIKYVDSTPAGGRVGETESGKEVSGSNARKSLLANDSEGFAEQTGIKDSQMFSELKDLVDSGVLEKKQSLIDEISEVKAKQKAHKKGGTPTMAKKIAKLEAELTSL